MCHVSMQSTSSANFSSVNSLNHVSFFTVEKKRGKEDQTRRWKIEMNEARQLYLKTYGKIDQANRRMSDFNIGIKTMKYWHSAMDYAFQLALVQSYDFYVEAARGEIDDEWELDPKKIWDFCSFLHCVSTQMLEFNPKDCAYPGDQFMRSVTHSNYAKWLRDKQRRINNQSLATNQIPGYVTEDQFKTEASKPNGRFCMDMGSLVEHLHMCECRLIKHHALSLN